MAMTVLTAIGVVAVLTIMLASLLIFASRKLHVDEDPRLDVVEEMLPHNNCGGCGYPSCRMFAEALVSAKALPGKCSVSSEQERTAVATFLNVEEGIQIKQVARLACAGGSNVARNQAYYQGLQTCGGAATVVGGGKQCSWGCLGLGDCERACDFAAIKMNPHGLPVVDENKCTACGDCIEACPKDLFSLQPVDQHLWVTCKNLEQGDQVLDYCQVACTACGRCAIDAPGSAITMVNNLPLLQYVKGNRNRNAIERCPTGAIVWIDSDGMVSKGAAAKKTIRHSALPPTVS